MHEELLLKNQLCFRLYSAARLVMQAYTPFLNQLDITYPQYLVLMVLWEKDSQPVNDIAHRLLLETNTVTPLLQRMEKKGIVLRSKGNLDKRQQIVSLTQKGRDMEQQAFEIIPQGMGERLTACPLSMNDFQNMASGLDGIIDTLLSDKLLLGNYLCCMVFGVNLVYNSLKCAVLIKHKCLAQSAHAGFSAHFLLSPCAKRL